MNKQFHLAVLFFISLSLVVCPAFSEEERVSGDIFGGNTGRYHPFVSISQQYSDNVFKTNDDRKGDLITAVSPGIWVAFPGIKEKMAELETTNTAPGGLSLSRWKPETFRRYQTYLLYAPEFLKYWNYSDEDIFNNKLEGAFQYNLRGGLSIDLGDQYLNAYEKMGEGISRGQDKFSSNLLSMILSYDASDKVSLRADISLFSLDYDDDLYSGADRGDSFFALYTYYRLTGKTSVYGEIEYTDITYDASDNYDSTETRYFAGVKWEVTEKSIGEFKAGYGQKNFDSPLIEAGSNFVMELKANHVFTPKTSTNFTILRRTNETTIEQTDYAVVNSFAAEYIQKFTERILGRAHLLYTGETYIGALNYDGEIKEREDTKIRISFTGEYKFNEKIFAEAEYSYTRRDSNVSFYDYSDNTVTLSFIGTF